MNLSDLLTTIWSALRGNIGGGQDFIVVYTALGAILWAFLLFKIFLQEGLQIASGYNSELPRILVKYLFVAAAFAVWPQAANSIFAAVKTLASMFYPSLNQLLDTMTDAMIAMSGGQQAATNSQGLSSTIIGTVYNFTLGSLFVGIGTIVLFICYALIMINMAGSLTILAMNLVLGPVFFALSFDRDFRSHALHWFAAVLSYFVLIPLYGAALTVATVIAGAAIPANLYGLPSGAQFAAQVIGPLMSVGVVFSTNRIVNALVGGAAGSGLGSMALGVAGIGLSLLPGGAIVRSTVTTSRAVVRSAASAGKTVASKISSTARAAIRK
ncbi:MAG: type IV secretion system protein [Acidobacteria bacterium]|nr:type IV secretion system protein [Acidobacteriota bacterium]